jgi:AraC family transcriptional regulator
MAMNLARPISRGWHFGRSMRSARLGRFVLTETQCPGDLRTPWHGHEAPAFCLVLRGGYVQRFRRREVVYRPAVALFRPRGTEHTDQVSPDGVACFIIEPDAAWLAGAGLDQLNREYALDRAGPRARWLLEHALSEFRAPDAATPLALEGLVLALGAEFARIAEPPSERRRPAWLLRTREALDAGWSSRVTLAELAAEAGVHPVYLATAFRAAYGSSVGEYVRARRVEAGRRALGDPARSISEIAVTLGFSSQSHFTAVFRRHTGLTPLAYRRLHPRP